MERGTVKWFNNTKGYGFLLSEDKSRDIFTHYSSIHMDGFRTLKAGQPVLFEATEGPRGLHATTVKLVHNEHALHDEHLPTVGTTIPHTPGE